MVLLGWRCSYEKSNRNTDTRRSAVRLCAVGRAERGGGDNYNDFIIRDNIDGKRKAVQERDHCGEQNNSKSSDNNADFGGDNYRSEWRHHDAHSAHVSDGENESGNYAADIEQARVGAVRACQGDHNDDNDCSSDYGTAEGNHNSNTDNAERSDYDYKSNVHSETESNDKADLNNSAACGDYDYENHSSKAADHNQNDDNCYRERHHLC